MQILCRNRAFFDKWPILQKVYITCYDYIIKIKGGFIMPNQPARDTVGIYIRVHKSIKDDIQADIERINRLIPGANMSIASWIRAAIDDKLANPTKKQIKNK